MKFMLAQQRLYRNLHWISWKSDQCLYQVTDRELNGQIWCPTQFFLEHLNKIRVYYSVHYLRPLNTVIKCLQTTNNANQLISGFHRALL